MQRSCWGESGVSLYSLSLFIIQLEESNRHASEDSPRETGIRGDHGEGLGSGRETKGCHHTSETQSLGLGEPSHLASRCSPISHKDQRQDQGCSPSGASGDLLGELMTQSRVRLSAGSGRVFQPYVLLDASSLFEKAQWLPVLTLGVHQL